MKQLIDNILKKLPPGFSRVFSNVSRQFGGQFFQLWVGFFIGVRFARYLGPENYGLFNYAIAITSIMAIFSTLGLDGIVVRELVKTPEKQNEIIWTSFILKLIWWFLVVLSSSTLVYFLNTDQVIGLYLTMIMSSIYILNAFNSIDFFFQAKLLSKYNVISKNIAFIIWIVLKLIWLVYWLSIIYFAVVMVVEAFIAFVFFVHYYHKSGNRIFSWKFDKNIARQLFRDSRPLMLSSISVVLYMRIDQVMIKNMLGDSELWIYSVAVKLTELLYFLPTIIWISVFPAIVNYKKKSKKIYYKRLEMLSKIMFLISFSISIIITLLSPFIINILFGIKYSLAVWILQIYIWTIIPIYTWSIGSKYLINENLTKFGLYFSLIWSFLNIGLNLIFIPILWVMWWVIATITTQYITMFSWILFKKTRKLWFIMLNSFNLFDTIIYLKNQFIISQKNK